MNLSCGTCERTLALRHVSDHITAVSTGFTSGWAINADVAWCPACATAHMANGRDEAGAVV